MNLKFLKPLLIVPSIILLAFACKEKAEKSSLPKLGTAAIDFNCQDLKGQTWSLDKVRGKVVLLRFWADWCPYCRYEMPIIDKYYRKLNKEGFLVLAVNVKQSAEVALAFTSTARRYLSCPLGSGWEDGQEIWCLCHPNKFSHRSTGNHP